MMVFPAPCRARSFLPQMMAMLMRLMLNPAGWFGNHHKNFPVWAFIPGGR